MTSDEIKKVREAAILLLRWHVGGIDSDESHPWHAMDFDDKGYEETEAIKVVCEFASSLVGTDVEQPITDEWLREEWKKLGGEIDLHSGREKYVHPHLEGWLEIQRGQVFYYADEHVEVVQLVTRYQFRLLAAALGIKRKGEES